MKNYWVDEKKIRDDARRLSYQLRYYLGKRVDGLVLNKTISLFVDMCDNQRVRDALMWKYMLKYDLDEQRLITNIEFKRMPWLI